MSKTTPEAQQLVKNLLSQPENAVCADCQHNVSKWASSTLGVFICYECSGIHRSLGTHITFVRSVTLDGWTPEQAKLMRRVGNKVANQYWEANLPRDFMRPSPFDRFGMEQFIRQKYVEHRWAAPGEPPHIAKLRSPYQRTPTQPVQQPQIQTQHSMPQIHTPPSPVAPISSGSNSENEPSAFDFIDSNNNTQTPAPTAAPTAAKVTQRPAKSSSPSARPHFAKREPSQTPPVVPQKPTVSEDSSFDFINEMSVQRQPQTIVADSKPAARGQSLFPKKPRGAARFMKKPTGDAVINQMLEMSSNTDFRPISAPVKPHNPGNAVSMFDGLDFSHAKH